MPSRDPPERVLEGRPSRKRLLHFFRHERMTEGAFGRLAAGEGGRANTLVTEDTFAGAHASRTTWRGYL